MKFSNYSRQLYTLFLVGYAVLFQSCSRIADEASSELFSSLPVVFSVISPDKNIQVSLSETYVVSKVNDTIVYPDAKVYIKCNNEHWVELNRLSENKAIYTDKDSLIDVSEGNTYFLRIEIGEQQITAQTTVPISRNSIVAAQFVTNFIEPEENNEYYGVLSMKFNITSKDQCIVYTNGSIIGVSKSLFLYQTELTDNVRVVADSVDYFKLQLLTLDANLARYLVAKEVSSFQNYSAGDFSNILGMYSGLIPPFSNINNGVGLFTSFSHVSKSVAVTKTAVQTTK